MSRQIVDPAPAPGVVETVVANPDAEESAFSSAGGGGDDAVKKVFGMAENTGSDANDGRILRMAGKALSEAREELSREEAERDESDGESGKMAVGGKEATVLDPIVSAGSDASQDDAKGADQEIEVTDAEKEAFLDSVIRGTRYEAPFSLFGGRMTGVFRSRTNGESAAIDSYARRLVRSGAIYTNSEFANVVRTCLLVACVKELDGVEFPEMVGHGESGKATVDFDTEKVVEPKWVDRLEYWRSRPDAVVSALMSEIVVFESKYWKMTLKARDENFWRTGGSTEG